jgi:sulfite reductase alpha subunit-like flavoprotein
MPSVQAVACPPGKKAAEDVERFVAPVKSTKQLLSDSTGDRATSLVTLDLSSMPYLQYSPGDYLVVYPENSPKVSLDALEKYAEHAEHCMEMCYDASVGVARIVPALPLVSILFTRCESMTY